MSFFEDLRNDLAEFSKLENEARLAFKKDSTKALNTFYFKMLMPAIRDLEDKLKALESYVSDTPDSIGKLKNAQQALKLVHAHASAAVQAVPPAPVEEELMEKEVVPPSKAPVKSAALLRDIVELRSTLDLN